MTEQPAWPEYANLTKPNIDLLKEILEDDTFLTKYNNDQLKAVQLKYQAMTANTNTIEKRCLPHNSTPSTIHVGRNPTQSTNYLNTSNASIIALITKTYYYLLAIFK